MTGAMTSSVGFLPPLRVVIIDILLLACSSSLDDDARLTLEIAISLPGANFSIIGCFGVPFLCGAVFACHSFFVHVVSFRFNSVVATIFGVFFYRGVAAER